MELARAIDILRGGNQGVLVTQRQNLRPQLSNILYAVDDAGIIRVSVTADRAKTKNLERTPLASLYATRENFWRYMVVDADADLSPVAKDPNDATVDELVDLYRALQGEHADWDDYRRAMVADKRLVVRLTPTHAYGAWPEA